MVRVRGVGALVVLRDLRVRDPHVRPGQGVATVLVLQGGPVVPGVLGCGAGDIGAVAAAVESWAGAIRPAGAGELDDVPKASWLQPRRRGVLDAVGGDEVLPAHGDLPAGGHHHPPGTGSGAGLAVDLVGLRSGRSAARVGLADLPARPVLRRRDGHLPHPPARAHLAPVGGAAGAYGPGPRARCARTERPGIRAHAL